MESGKTPKPDNRKRTRDGDDDATNESHQGKKQECPSPDNSGDRYGSCDGVGVFDFPWLKEGVVFKGNEYLDDHHDEEFSPRWYLDEPTVDDQYQYCLENLCVSPAMDDDEIKSGDDGFWSFLADDLEPFDCIWSCVIDQPLDIGFNKG